MSEAPPGGALERNPLSGLVRNVGVLWGAETVYGGVGFVQVLIASRVLGPSDYGVAAVVLTFPLLVYSLLEPKAGQALVKFGNEQRRRGDVASLLATTRLAYVAELTAAALSVVVVAMASRWTLDRFGAPLVDTWLPVAVAAGLVLRSVTTSSSALLSMFEKFSSIARARVFAVVGRLAVLLALLKLGLRVEAVVYAYVAGLACECAWTSVAARRELRVVSEGVAAFKFRSLPQRRAIARFILFTDASGLLGVLATQLDLLVVSASAGAVQAGYYRLGREFGAVATGIVAPLQSVLYARFSRLAAHDGWTDVKRVQRWVFRMITMPSLLLAPFALPLIAAATPLVAGNAYRGAIGAVQALVLQAIVWIAFFHLRPFLFAVGRVRAWTVATAAAVVLTLSGYAAVAELESAAAVGWIRFAGMGVVLHLVAGYFSRSVTRIPRSVSDVEGMQQ